MKSSKVIMNTICIMVLAIHLITVEFKMRKIETALLIRSSSVVGNTAPVSKLMTSSTSSKRSILPNPGPVTQLAKDFRAICLWEGRGQIDLDAYNKKEDAIGPAQIRKGYLQDSNEWLESHGQRTFTHEEMYDYDCAFAVFCAYQARYGNKTTEERARGHNGNFASKKATQTYWEGVQSCIGK